MKDSDELGTFYRLCTEMKWLPDQVRKLSTTDYIRLIADLSRHNPKPLAWDQGGKGIVMGWYTALKKQQERKLCPKR